MTGEASKRTQRLADQTSRFSSRIRMERSSDRLRTVSESRSTCPFRESDRPVLVRVCASGYV